MLAGCRRFSFFGGCGPRQSPFPQDKTLSIASPPSNVYGGQGALGVWPSVMWPSNPGIDLSAGSGGPWLDDRHTSHRPSVCALPRPPARNGRRNEPTNQAQKSGPGGCPLSIDRSAPALSDDRAGPERHAKGSRSSPNVGPVDWFGSRSLSSRWCVGLDTTLILRNRSPCVAGAGMQIAHNCRRPQFMQSIP